MADKALLTGINDYQSIGDLRGCLNDLESMQQLLVEQFGFKKSSIRVRKDSQVNKLELRKQWQWLLKDASPGDRLIFHFSGHGSYTADLDGDEDDGADELLCLHGMDWNNDDTYLRDDELRAWTAEVPEAVELTIVLDCCHSGTGTRMIAPPASKSRSANPMQAITLVDVQASLSRLEKAGRARATPRDGTRGAAAALTDVLPESADQMGPESVVARFAPPPQYVVDRIRRAGVRGGFRRRDAVPRSDQGEMDAAAGMNHVLWAGSRDDQTSADAHIGGDYHGAFTYYFCELAAAQGSVANSQDMIQALREKLRQEGFGQVPQLEPEEFAGGLFRGTTFSEFDVPPTVVGPGTQGPSGNPPAEFWSQLLSTMQSIQQLLSASGRDQVPGGSPTARHALVYVHGICLHKPGYSNPWWQSLAPHLRQDLRIALQENRHEVLWSEHVSPTDRALSVARAAEQRELQALEQRIRDVLRDRAAQEVATAIRMAGAGDGSADRGVESVGVVPRALFGIPGLDCVDDFTKYLVFESTRTAVIAEFSSVVRPLLAQGHTIDVISHSWGTVVAYEALRQLEDDGLPGRVRNFFTVGAALAISLIADRIRPSDGRKPTLVDRWINLDATGDIVGGSLQAVGMAIDREFLDLSPSGCDPIGWPFKFYQPACAHSSYFQANNLVVNRDIFAATMNRTGVV